MMEIIINSLLEKEITVADGIFLVFLSSTRELSGATCTIAELDREPTSKNIYGEAIKTAQWRQQIL